MDKQRMIDELTGALQAQIEQAERLRLLLAGTLMKRPATGQWNVQEVFAHLVLSSGVYERGLHAVFARKAALLPNSPSFTPGVLGGYFTRTMEPKPDGRITWKMKTMRMFDPAKQDNAPSAPLQAFIDLSNSLLGLLERARSTDLDRMKVVSTLGPLVRFKAGDAFRFVVAHHKRHFLQIERLLVPTPHEVPHRAQGSSGA